MSDNLNDRIKKAMEASGMKAVDICEKANIPKSSMSMYLSGKVEPKSDRLYLIAKCLGVSESWLLGYSTNMHEKTLSLNKKASFSIANNLRRAREAAGLTVEEAAASIGVDVEEIIKSESPACRLRHGDKLLEDLCTLYKTSPYSVLPLFDPEAAPTDEDMKLMLFGGFSSVTDEMLEEVKRYAEYLISSKNAKKPAADHGNRLYEIVSIFSQLSEDNRSKLLELANLFLTAQSKTEESK